MKLDLMKEFRDYQIEHTQDGELPRVHEYIALDRAMAGIEFKRQVNDLFGTQIDMPPRPSVFLSMLDLC